MVKNPPAMQETWFNSWVEKILGVGNGNSLQYSCLGNPKDRGAWWAIVHGIQRVGYNLGTKQQHVHPYFGKAHNSNQLLVKTIPSIRYTENCWIINISTDNDTLFSTFLMPRSWWLQMASPTRWSWVWVNSRRWWWTGRPGMLQFMELQRVGHDWVNELNWTTIFLNSIYLHIYCIGVFLSDLLHSV